MKKGISIALLIFILFIGVFFTYKQYQHHLSEERLSIQLNELRGVTKLVIWEQDFTLHNTESISKKYLGIVETKESIHSSIQGSMGFHIDLSDSIHSLIDNSKDTIYIHTPIQNTYISLDLATLEQVKESSLDPTLELKKEDVIKNLKQKAVEQQLPQVINNLKQLSLSAQEENLSRLTNKPVKIMVTNYPTKENFINWND